MPLSNVSAGDPHVTAHNAERTLINSSETTINSLSVAQTKAVIGTTRTASYTLTQANSGEVIPINSATSVSITVPVLEAGTSIELLRMGAGAVTLTTSGVTFTIPAGNTATPRVQGSVISLLWLTTTTVLIGGDVT